MISDLPPRLYIRQHCLGTLPALPLAKQIELLTSLAAIERDEEVATQLRRHADELRDAARHQTQLLLNLSATAHAA